MASSSAVCRIRILGRIPQFCLCLDCGPSWSRNLADYRCGKANTPSYTDTCRRLMLITSQTGCALMMTIYTSLVATFSGTTNKPGQGVAVAFLYLFVTFYASCVDAVSYVYCTEIFPTELRASGMGASVATLFATTLRTSPQIPA